MKSQVKILFVITQGFWGGAQKYVLDLASHLGPNFDVAIALGSEDYQAFRTKITEHNPQIQIYPLKHLKREISPLHDLLAIRELQQLYQDLQPDIVHLNSSKAGVLGSLAKNRQTKIVYTAHGWVFLEPLGFLRRGIYRLAEKYTARYKDVIIVLSDEDKKIAQDQLDIPAKQLFTIPLGVAAIAFLEKNQARQKIQTLNPAINPQKLWILTVANHYKSKGLDILIHAIGNMSAEEQNAFQLCVLGDGPERTALQTDINILHLEKTIFLLPFIENAATYLPAADLFVLASRKEGLPYVLLEALQARLPIIATRVGGVPSLLHQVPNASLIAPQNSPALSEALQNFLKQSAKTSPDSALNTKESTEYSLSSMLEKTSTIYSSVLD